MIVGILELELHLAESCSLKDKRRVIKSLVDQIHNKFNVAVAEVGRLDNWRSSILGIACVSNEKKQVNRVLNRVRDFVASDDLVELINMHLEIL